MKENKIKNENYILIQGFMVSELNLKGNELLIYAIIYGFSQAENQVFNGSLQYLADWTNSTKQGVIKCLKSLIEKGYIEKNEKYINNVKFCEYYSTKFNRVLNKVERGIKQSLTNNIDNNINNNIDIKEKNIKKEKYGKYGRVKLTKEEYKRLTEEFGENFIKEQIELLDEYVETNNNKNKYTNFNLVLRKSIRENWFRKRNEAIPNWFDKKAKEEELTKDEEKVFDELLNNII